MPLTFPLKTSLRLLLLTIAAAPALAAAPAPDAARIRQDVEWLAADERQGRGIGTAGLVAAEEWLAVRFRELGLEPAGDDGYFQGFEVPTQTVQGAATSLLVDGQPVEAESFRLAAFTSPGEASAPLVVAGYGITAPDLTHDDYEKLDVKGKIVLLRRFTPTGARFAGEDSQRRFGDLRYKAFNAREHGAIGVLIVDWPELLTGETLPEEARLPDLKVDSKGDAGLPVMILTRAAGKPLFTGEHQVKMVADMRTGRKKTRNVLGWVRAGAANADKRPGALVVGAHFDHLGLGGHSGSLAPDSQEPHNGADDNASGTAAILEIARVLQERRGELERDVLIAAFSGEEYGLLGSAAFARQPTGGYANEAALAMINLDMVGRLRDDKLQILGTASAAEWQDLLTPLCARRKLECKMGGDGYGPSDQMSFYTVGTPVLHFFTGTHEDYHKPSDDSGKVNAEGAAKVAALVADALVGLSRRPDKLTYVAATAPAPQGDSRQGGAGLGTIPDYADDKPGVRISGARPDSAAAKAGIQPGDRIVELGGSQIRNIYDYVYVLRNAKPGDKAKIVVLRGEQRLELEVTYDEGRRRP
jgi:hypothetical protein